MAWAVVVKSGLPGLNFRDRGDREFSSVCTGEGGAQVRGKKVIIFRFILFAGFALDVGHVPVQCHSVPACRGAGVWLPRRHSLLTGDIAIIPSLPPSVCLELALR